MKVIDLTHTIREDMPVYPRTETPGLLPASSYEKDGFKETLLHMYSHTGTHMDPPAHLYEGRTTLDQFPADQFVGQALVIDCRDLARRETPLPWIASGDTGPWQRRQISCFLTWDGISAGEQRRILEIIPVWMMRSWITS